jgi:hypothetical protein
MMATLKFWICGFLLAQVIGLGYGESQKFLRGEHEEGCEEGKYIRVLSIGGWECVSEKKCFESRGFTWTQRFNPFTNALNRKFCLRCEEGCRRCKDRESFCSDCEDTHWLDGNSCRSCGNFQRQNAEGNGCVPRDQWEQLVE